MLVKGRHPAEARSPEKEVIVLLGITLVLLRLLDRLLDQLLQRQGLVLEQDLQCFVLILANDHLSRKPFLLLDFHLRALHLTAFLFSLRLRVRSYNHSCLRLIVTDLFSWEYFPGN